MCLWLNCWLVKIQTHYLEPTIKVLLDKVYLSTLTAAANFVLIIPGATQLTRIFFSAKSIATTFVNPRSAVLLTEYAPNAYKTKQIILYKLLREY